IVMKNVTPAGPGSRFKDGPNPRFWESQTHSFQGQGDRGGMMRKIVINRYPVDFPAQFHAALYALEFPERLMNSLWWDLAQEPQNRHGRSVRDIVRAKTTDPVIHALKLKMPNTIDPLFVSNPEFAFRIKSKGDQPAIGTLCKLESRFTITTNDN